MKWYKQFVSWLSLSVLLLLPIFSHLDSYASETTSSGSEQWTMSAETFLYYAFNGFAKQISAPYVVFDTFSDFGYDGFRLWCENGDHWSVIEDGEVVGHGGGGYSRPSDKIDYAENIEVPTDIKNLVLNYVQYNVTQNPLPYKECYIPSYSKINTSQFLNYTQYKSVQEIIKSCNGYTFFMTPNSLGTQSQNNTYIITVDREKYPINFIGTSTQGGFTNVGIEHNWVMIGSFPQNTDGIDIRMMRNMNGSIGAPAKTYAQAATNAGYSSTYVPPTSSISNTTAFFVNNKMSVFTNRDQNELIYCFTTLNGYKNYNAGNPQPYYLTTTGANTGTWTASGGGVINTGSMTNSGNYYSQVTNGVGSNWTPEQIIQLVDTVVNGSGGSGGSGSGSNDNPFGFLGKIGELIGELVSGVGDLLTGIVDGIANVFLGTPDENGVRQGGLFSVVRGVINGLVELIDTDFVEFFNVVFDWLPQEVITLMIAGLTFALFFGILKMIRG